MEYSVICENCKLHCDSSKLQLEHTTQEGIEKWKCNNFEPAKVIDRSLIRYLYNSGRIRNLENYIETIIKDKEP